jgi:hypothetical protein
MKTKLIIVLLILLSATLSSTSIEFDFVNLEAKPATGPWMFDADDPGYVTDDENAYTQITPSNLTNNWAYRNFSWSEDTVNHPSSSTCTAEDLVVADGTGNLKLKLSNFTIAGFEHLNTQNEDESWDATAGDDAFKAGDRRVYLNGIGAIYDGDMIPANLKLKVVNCRLTVVVSYPTKSEMDAIVGLVAGTWQNDVGAGNDITATGWGTMDPDSCDVAWYNEFNQGGVHEGQLRFTFNTFDAVIQDDPGYYNFHISVFPAPHIRRIRDFDLSVEGMNFDLNSADEALDCDIEFNFTDTTRGGVSSEEDQVLVTQYYDTPNGVLPAEIQSIADQYWHLSTTMEAFTTSVTFDLEDIPNLGNTSELRILRRASPNAEWQVYNDFTLVDGTHLRANNVQAFSEWAVGSRENGSLPVELSSFNAVQTSANLAKLNWITQTESDMRGYYVYRANSNDISESIKLNTEIIASQNSAIATTYTYEDATVETGKTYYYWLESQEHNGLTKTFGPATLSIVEDDDAPQADIPTSSFLDKSYPNPFTVGKSERATITINYGIKENDEGSIDIYNLEGQMVKSFNSLKPGYHSIVWDAKDSNGKKVSSGVYFYRLKTNTRNVTNKLMIVK